MSIRPADPPTEVLPEWLAVAERMPARGRVLVIGPTDSGKSTIAWWLAGWLHGRDRAGPQSQPGDVAVVDTDVGQSRIGPPACVGRCILGATDCCFYFVGATSPDRRPAGTLKATVTACEHASQAGVHWTVVDTTGYVDDTTAIALKTAKISKLRPCHVLAIGDAPALADILKPWREDPSVSVHRVARPPAARAKSRPERTRWRQDGFAPWLSGANLHWLDGTGRRFLDTPPAELYARNPSVSGQLKGLLVGFSDAEGKGLALGLLRAFDFAAGKALVLCREEALAATTVAFGALRLRPDGTQIPEPR